MVDLYNFAGLIFADARALTPSLFRGFNFGDLLVIRENRKNWIPPKFSYIPAKKPTFVCFNFVYQSYKTTSMPMA